jgi:putative ABC transport system ATP-binding protein
MLLINRLEAGYGTTALVSLDRLAVLPGQAALLTGSSGAGKTTLLLAVAGLADVLAGELSLGGTDLRPLSKRARDRHRGRNIAVIFQDLHLVAGLTAMENMLLAPYATGSRQDGARAQLLLDRLGVGHHARRKADSLSRGEAQRVAIARAMLVRPQVILADEPTASLDDESCDRVISLLMDAAEESGAALVVATHDGRIKHRIRAHVAVEKIG